MAFAFVVLALVIYFEFISPAYSDAQNLKAKLQSEQSFLTSEKDTIGKVQQLIASYQSEQQVQDAVSSALPTEEDLPEAIVQVYGLLQQSVLSLQAISVSVQGVQNTPASTGGTDNTAISLQKPVGTVTLSFKFSGGYENLKNFLSLLETNIRILDLKSLSIGPTSLVDAKGKPLPGVYDFNASAIAYFQPK